MLFCSVRPRSVPGGSAARTISPFATCHAALYFVQSDYTHGRDRGRCSLFGAAEPVWLSAGRESLQGIVKLGNSTGEPLTSKLSCLYETVGQNLPRSHHAADLAA